MRNQSFIASPAVDRLAGFGNLLIAVLAFGMLAGAARADEASPQAARPQAPNALQDVVDAMYNAEYDKALSIVRGWLKAHPGDVQAWNYVAEATLDQEMLKENLYSGSAFLNSGKVFKKRQEPLPPGFETELNAALDHAQQLEEERLRRNPKDEEALYWLGVTYSTRTEFLFTLERSYFSSLREGKRAWEVNERLLKMDPHCADADLVIGIADYAAGLLPWYLRMVTSIAGIHGNAKRGIQELKHASQQGRYTRVDAKTILVMIYERQKEYPQALALLQELRQEFSWNYLVCLEMARVDKAEGHWTDAAAVYDAAVEKFVRGEQNLSHAPRALILLRAGEAHEHLGGLQDALDLYHEAGNIPGKDKAIYQADLAAARLDQHFNHSERARKEYQLVADSVPDSDLGGAARQALQELR
ncbi:MAG: tetratricopeptide repeat protein [Terriglobia bacterium]